MTASGSRKRRWVLPLQRYVLNPPVKAAVWLGLVPAYALIETTGRRTRRRRTTVVGVSREDDHVWIVAEQGRHAGYVRNLDADPSVRLRLRGRWVDGVAHVVEDDDPERRLERFGRAHAGTVRSFGTDLLTIRVDLADHPGANG